MKDLKKEINNILNLFRSNKLLEAESLNKEIIRYFPKETILYNILGLILAEQKKFDEAIEYYEKGIKIKPDFAILYNNLGSIYKSRGKFSKAETLYKKAIYFDKKIAEPHNNLGNLYHSLNKHKKAVQFYKNAIEINDKFYISHYNLGVIYKSLGDIDKAHHHLNESIRINELFCTAYRILSQITKYKKNDKQLIILDQIYNKSEINNFDKAEIAFALGKAYDDISDYKKAFKYYFEGNELRRKNITFSIDDVKKEFNEIKKFINKDFFQSLKNFGSLDKTPIFILGMPRSGTTLVEQIISNHPAVFGGDELNFFPEIVKKYFYNPDNKVYLNNLSKMNNEYKKIAMVYINNLKKISDSSKRVTDKLPVNFKWIGLIKILFPNSIVIHCKRNSKDTCLSIFKNYFTNNELNFAYNLKELSEYYNEYNNLMNHWNSLLPNFIYEITYEQLIQNPKAQIRNLLKACNLKWNDNCIKFYNNRRVIKTASDTQVRKKIYSDSINVWKNYKKYLKSFYNELPK